ncbi:type I-E CRISPR-associated protein Cas5/CasD [Paracoccus sp. p4-l81]|uniref:type I-E CRISPR-associated protein Cas5/CasD n=1 Tax=Paracoccus sp. p4-l81 TaxID=3342806 RepID=UPI0035B7046D
MADYLTFHLTAALGAMGELAGHERRGSLTWPGRSALIGLMGAALGIRRDGDFSALEALHTAVAIFDAGAVLRDYHTVETVPSAAAKRPQSRPAALRAARGRTNTTITLRDYRAGPLYGVAVWGGDLGALAKAVKTPVFTLYLGRKSCPLAAPLNPQIVQADSPEAALAALRLPAWHRGARATQMACDHHPAATRREARHDIATDRRAWHFAPRSVAMVAVDITPEAAT